MGLEVLGNENPAEICVAMVCEWYNIRVQPKFGMTTCPSFMVWERDV